MKYGNTSRSLCLLFHGLIFAAFVSLGIYYGFFLTPFYLDPSMKTYWSGSVVFGAYNLYLELGVVGLSLAVVSGYGFYQAVKAMMAPSDDKPVIKSFTAFIADGYIASVFFILQGLLLFDLTANNNLAFVIIMAILLSIILLIATNIPMVRLFDGKDQTPLVVGLNLAGAVTAFWVAIETFLTVIGFLKYTADSGSSLSTTSYSAYFLAQLLIGTLGGLLVGGLLLASGIVTLKKGVKDPKASLLSGYLTGGSIFGVAAVMISLSIIELVNHDLPIHLESNDNFTSNYGWGYGIMGVILGAGVLAAAIYFMIVTAKEGKKKALPQA
jgi:hypothetical protein